jgi:hypothetical protein
MDDRATAQAADREAATAERLRETNRELAKVPVLEHRLAAAEEENAELSRRLQEVGETLQELTGSSSWRLTASLRSLGRLRSRRRRG